MTKPVILLLAAVLLLTTGTIIRWVRVSRASETFVFTPLSASLSELPARLGSYALVQDLPLATNVLAAARVDSFVQRDYVDTTTGRHVLLYVGYWGHENKGLSHGPEVCYPAVGWNADGAPVERTIHPGAPLHKDGVGMALHRFERTEPEGIEKRAVGFLAIVDGEYRPSSRGIFRHQPGRLNPARGHYLVQVQVSRSVVNTAWDAAASDIVAFMELLLPHLSQCLPNADKGGSLG